MLTAIDGSRLNDYTYEAYGSLISQNGSIPNNYLYTGEQYIPELDSYYLRARNYVPGIGRFASMDSFDGIMSQPLTLNKYEYTEGRPTILVDPSGQFSLVELEIVNKIRLDITKQQITAGYRLWWKAYNILSRGLNWTEEDEKAAEFADDVYDKKNGGLLRSKNINYEPKDGFAAALYEWYGVYYLVFRGTDDRSDDWTKGNIPQAFGKYSSQYCQALILAGQVQTLGNVVFVGHSLGGGLASAAAAATGRRAITFNAAGLHSVYGGNNYAGEVRAHYIFGDPLTMANMMLHNIIPMTYGHLIPHKPKSESDSLKERHSIDQFLNRDRTDIPKIVGPGPHTIFPVF